MPGSAKESSTSSFVDCEQCPPYTPPWLYTTYNGVEVPMANSVAKCWAAGISFVPPHPCAGGGPFGIANFDVCCDEPGVWKCRIRIAKNGFDGEPDVCEYVPGEVGVNSCQNPIDLSLKFNTCCGDFNFHVTE